MLKTHAVPERVREYKNRIAAMGTFSDQSKKPEHGQGKVKEKYWFSANGEIFPVEREHGDQALKIVRELELIDPMKSISNYGYRSNWELAVGLLLKRGWLRVQCYAAKTIGIHGITANLRNKSVERAALTVLAQPHGFIFEEGWPISLKYITTEHEYRKSGWGNMIKRARQKALINKTKAAAELAKYSRT